MNRAARRDPSCRWWTEPCAEPHLPDGFYCAAHQAAIDAEAAKHRAAKSARLAIRARRFLTSESMLPGDARRRAGEKVCRWCVKPLTGRRTSWCSDACAHEYLYRTSATGIRKLVHARDRGVCALCGAGYGGRWSPSWQADHIVPIVEGGAGTDLANLRTLCTACHKGETAKLAARRAAAKRPPRVEPAMPLFEGGARA